MQEENVYYVYLHRRGDNNEVFYVGKGKNRRAYHKDNRNRWWTHIVDKVGFIVEFVEKKLSEESAFDLEIETIKFYRDNGHQLVNMTNGGEGQKGARFSEEHKRKLSQSMMGNKRGLGHKDTDETRKQKSLSRTGKKHSEETKKKIVESRKIPVQCSNGMSFKSAVDAAMWLRDNGYEKAVASAVRMCCYGTRHVAYGFKWCFMNEPEENLLYVAVTRSQRVLEINQSVKEVLYNYKIAYVQPLEEVQ